MGQDIESYLDGLLYADYLTYWDYIHLDTLLSLQTPKTQIPDEEIFIMYHQITELYFKLCLHEYNQLKASDSLTSEELLMRVNRINRYFGALTHSFDVMVDGMDPKQFLQFRMSLLPASGFQSAQYRMIEICAAQFKELLHPEVKEGIKELNKGDLAAQYEQMYWKRGATELSTGNKTLTLRQFEKKYSRELIALAEDNYGRTVWDLFEAVDSNENERKELIVALKWLDAHVNINWPLSHYKSAVRYLERNPEDIAATGGTNWQKYLPPRFQKRIFFPELYSEQEIAEWGKGWVKEVVFGVG